MKGRTRFAAASAALAALAIVAATAIAPSATAVGAKARDGRVVGYFIEWGIYGRGYRVKDVKTSGSAERLTTINYAFGNVAPDAGGDVVCKLGDEWADYQVP